MWRGSAILKWGRTGIKSLSAGKINGKGILLSGCLLTLFALTSCSQKMANQPKFIPLRQNTFYADGLSSRPLVEGTVPRGYLRADTDYFTGKYSVPPSQPLHSNGKGPFKNVPTTTKDVEDFPFVISHEILNRGQERFDIFCAPCHGRLGDGEGMVSRRGFRHPPSYHTEQLRKAPVGHFYDVITNGFGAMQDYATQIAPEDRWAIVAYIRALQLSQNATLAEVPENQRRQLATGGPAK
jgi:mono/diheme cytochrome c family protein